MIYLLTNVAKTQNVPLDGTIFFGNTGQKDKATFIWASDFSRKKNSTFAGFLGTNSRKNRPISR